MEENEFNSSFCGPMTLPWLDTMKRRLNGRLDIERYESKPKRGI